MICVALLYGGFESIVAASDGIGNQSNHVTVSMVPVFCKLITSNGLFDHDK